MQNKHLLAQQLSNMIVLATQRHDGQFDRGGMPYILHCLKVMHYTKSDDMEVMMMACGHDLFEDTFTDIESGSAFLRARGFSDRVINGIAALTKIESEAYEDYKKRVMANRDAVIVKMADLRHNSDIRRLKGITEKDIRRMERYHQFYLELKERLSEFAS